MTNSVTGINLFQGLVSIGCNFAQIVRRAASRYVAALFPLALASFLTCLTCLIVVPPAAAQNATTFKGEVTDEHLNCIQTPLKAVEGVNDKVSCVLYWAHFVQPPSKYVLYDAASKTTYQLSDQNMVQPYVGEKVEVTGKLDAASKTIQVTDIKARDDNPKKS
jgi:hypothetical protein